jgi:hypothetical protein
VAGTSHVRAPQHAAGSPRWAFRRLRGPYEDAPATVERFSVADTPVAIAWTSEALRRALRPAIAHLETTARAAVMVTVADAVTSGVRMPPFPWEPGDVGPRGDVAAASGDGVQTSYFAPSRALSMYDADEQRGFFWVPNGDSLASHERAAPLRTIFHWIGVPRGRRLAHAAAVGTAGVGALLAGRGGSGKSTTALLCLLAGMEFAGDDYVAVASEPLPTAFGLFGTLKVTPETLALVSRARDALMVPPSGADKGIVLGSAVEGARVVRRLPLRTVIVPRVTRERQTRARRASAAEVMLALGPTTMFQLPGNDAVAFDQLTSLARRLPGWTLELGSDLAQIPDRVAELLTGGAT